MTEPLIAHRKPYYAELTKGKSYFWCSCGRSQKQPFCDGAHKGSGFEPVKYVAKAEGEEVLFCGCKHTKTGPFCDGSHNNLPGGYEEDDPESTANRKIGLAARGDGPVTRLDGLCYIYATAAAVKEERDGFSYCTVISPRQGARHQSQFYAELTADRSPIIAMGGRHVILFVAAGAGTVTVSGRDFAVKANDGIYIRPAEAFALSRGGGEPLRVFISVCPGAAALEWAAAMPTAFDGAQPNQIASVDPAKRHTMAARFFQLLVDKSLGSDVVTQFIGHIPLSKAEPHRHLYEEALIILSGEGMMWTESKKASVKAGDVIFLPSKQVHSLQSVTASGMEVVGVIYPGDNPSINY